MEPELMPELEENLYGTFGVKRVQVIKRSNIDKLHKAIENYTGQKYVAPEKTLKQKVDHIIRLAGEEGEWDARTMQRHLYFFHQKDFNLSSIGKQLKKLAKSGILKEVSRGVYKKEGK